MSSIKTPCVPDMLPIDIEWKSLVSLIGQAGRAIARYDGTLEGIVNSAVLLSPLTAREAVMSSKIEGTQATLVEVLQHEAGEEFGVEKTGDIKEIVNYRKALFIAEDYLKDRPLSLSLIRELHDILMDSVRGKDKKPGAFRADQNWIGKPGDPIEKARFVPPEPLVMKGALDNLQAFMSGDMEDPLVQMAIIHAQFEIIHPFNDGNGRLGRMLIPLFLYQKKILQRPVFYLSEFLEEHDEEYRERLLAISESGDWQGWVNFFLKGILVQAERNAEKAKRIHDLYERMKRDFSNVTNSKYALAALDSFFARPIINASDFYEMSGMPTKPTAHNILKALMGAGLITVLKEGRGQTPAVFALPELINASEGRDVFVQKKG